MGRGLERGLDGKRTKERGGWEEDFEKGWVGRGLGREQVGRGLGRGVGGNRTRKKVGGKRTKKSGG